MKLVLVIGVIVIALGAGSYAYYKACNGFNSCINPNCQQDCYENGVRIR
jgi:hypothetical protein